MGASGVNQAATDEVAYTKDTTSDTANRPPEGGRDRRAARGDRPRRGLGTLRRERQDRARSLLGFPDDPFCAYLVALGYPADGPLTPIARPNRRPFDEVVLEPLVSELLRGTLGEESASADAP
jgi:hypothetical protein